MAPVKGSKRKVKVLVPLDFSKITVSKVPPADMTAYRPHRGERDAEQRNVDSIVDVAYRQWESAGKPQNWDEAPGMFLKVPDEAVETVQTRVRRAATMYNLSVKFGSIQSADGYSTVVFVASDPRPRKPRGSSAAETEQ